MKVVFEAHWQSCLMHLTTSEGEVWLDSLLGGVCDRKINLRVNVEKFLGDITCSCSQCSSDLNESRLPPTNMFTGIRGSGCHHHEKYRLFRRGGCPATQTLLWAHKISNTKSKTKATAQIRLTWKKGITPRTSPTKEYIYSPEKRPPHL